MRRACIAFEGDRCIARGGLREMARLASQARDDGTTILFFDGETSEVIDFDLRGSLAEILARLPEETSQPTDPAPSAPAAPARGPGRPKLGVVAREVTLLPRHWDWLAAQRGGASVALRRLVDEARRANRETDRVRQAQEAVYRFIAAMGENKPHYEEVARALFARDAGKFAHWTESWPADIRDHARHLAARVFGQAPPETDA